MLLSYVTTLLIFVDFFIDIDLNTVGYVAAI
jgi:hypothetical protein